MGTRLLNVPSTVRRPTGSCGSAPHAFPAEHPAEMGVRRLTWFGPAPRSGLPAALNWATSIAWKMNRRSLLSMVNPFPTGAVCACTWVAGYIAMSRTWLKTTMLRHWLLALILTRLICKPPISLRPPPCIGEGSSVSELLRVSIRQLALQSSRTNQVDARSFVEDGSVTGELSDTAARPDRTAKKAIPF